MPVALPIVSNTESLDGRCTHRLIDLAIPSIVRRHPHISSLLPLSPEWIVSSETVQTRHCFFARRLRMVATSDVGNWQT